MPERIIEINVKIIKKMWKIIKRVKIHQNPVKIIRKVKKSIKIPRRRINKVKDSSKSCKNHQKSFLKSPKN